MRLRVKAAAKIIISKSIYFLSALRYPFRGAYGDFPEAVAAAGTGQQIGYDHTDMAELYLHRIGRLNPSDYASMWWLSRLVSDNLVVADFGGNVALEYSSFARYIPFPPSLKWLICDVPAVIQYARKIAGERKFSNVSFTTSFADFDGADILHSSGTLQYIEHGLAECLESLVKKPRHLILNRLPIHENEEFVTLQRIDATLCPYHVYQRRRFIGSLEALGYELVDSWQCAEVTFCLLFHPEKELTAYSGFYFRLKDQQSI